MSALKSSNYSLWKYTKSRQNLLKEYLHWSPKTGNGQKPMKFKFKCLESISQKFWNHFQVEYQSRQSAGQLEISIKNFTLTFIAKENVKKLRAMT